MTTANNNEASGAAMTGASPASWQLDPSGTTVTIEHKHTWGLGTVRGSFGQVSGSGEILPDGTGRGRLEIGAESIDTKNRQRDNHLRSKDFFHASEHPHIVVDVTRIVRQGGDTVAAEGTLTVAGRTQPLALTGQVTESSDAAVTISADAEINRADFGMSWNRLGVIKGNAKVHVVARFVR
jgi:polyisoprenoid-binding protein YceI